MDYEKEYKAALERCREFYAKLSNKQLKEEVEDIFPELKESGNIRIIKAIKYGLDHVFTNNTTVFEVTKEQCLAWLEKQGKNNMGISEATKKKLEDNLNKALEKETPESWNKFLDEQGKQKPVDFSDLRTWKYIVDAVWTEKEGIGQYLDSPFTEEVAKKLQKRFGNIEQKPTEWSEEDENRINRLIAYFEDKESFTAEDDIVYANWLKSLKDRVQPKQEWSEEDESKRKLCFYYLTAQKNYQTAVGIDYINGCFDWLDSIKERVLPQPKPAWSEEDEQLYNDLSDTYFYNDEDYPEETYKLMLKRVLDWMTKRAKSLRPQSTWKPTEQQMKVLNEVINFAADHGTMRWNDYIYNVLKGLREQLKKL